MRENAVKVAIAAAGAAVIGYLGELVVPIIILALVMIIDYATGLGKAWSNSELSSRIGIVGILKKVGYLAIVAIGMVIDWVLRQGFNAIGADISFDFLFAIIVIIWLILNESISILENVAATGAPVPGFLMKIIDKLKSKVEKQGDTEVFDEDN